MRTFALILSAAAVLGACDAPYDPDAPAIDPNAPRLRITSPARGAIAGDVRTVVVTGTVVDDDAIASVTVNDVAATLDGAGGFTATVPVEPGTNLLHAIAVDAAGNKSKETRSVVAGKLASLDRMIPQAITASLSAQTFDALGRGAAGFLKVTDLTAMVQPLNPVVDSGTTNGQPDCLYAQAFVTGVGLGDARIALVPQRGGLGLDVVLDNVRVDLFARWAVSCLDGSRNVTVTANRVRLASVIGIGVDRGDFAIAFRDPDVQLTGFQVEVGGIPQTIIDMLALDTRVGPLLAWATERYLVPMLDTSLAKLGETKTIEVLGKQLDVQVLPAALDFDLDGAIVQLDTKLRARGDAGAPGMVYVRNTAPAMTKAHGFQLAVADDAANQLLASLWAARALDLGLDLANGTYGQVGTLYDRVELSAKAMPYLDASRDRLALTVGDLIATFKRGDAIATQVAINARVELAVLTDPATGALRLDVGTPVTYVDILDENVDGANQLSNAQFEVITTFALARVIAVGSGSVGAIPLPAIGGVALEGVGVTQQAGYLVVDGVIK